VNRSTGRDDAPVSALLVSTLLVSTGALAAELAQDPPPVLLDVRWRLGGPPGMDSYRQGHLPGRSSPTWTGTCPDRPGRRVGTRCPARPSSRPRCAPRG